jgi:hypothetical protein
VHDVLGIRVQHDSLAALERIQRFDGGSEFHAIVGRIALAAVHRLAMLAGDQQDTPATGTGIPPAGPVGVNLN